MPFFIHLFVCKDVTERRHDILRAGSRCLVSHSCFRNQLREESLCRSDSAAVEVPALRALVKVVLWFRGKYFTEAST